MISSIALAWYAASTAWNSYRDKRQYDLGDADRKIYGSEQHFMIITILLMMSSMLFKLTNMQYMLYFFPINFIFAYRLYKQDPYKQTGFKLLFILSGNYLYYLLIEMVLEIIANAKSSGKKAFTKSSEKKAFLWRLAGGINDWGQRILNQFKNTVDLVFSLLDGIFSDKLIKMIDQSLFSIIFSLGVGYFAWQLAIGSNMLLASVALGFMSVMLLRDLNLLPSDVADLADNLCKIGLLAVMMSGQSVSLPFSLLIAVQILTAIGPAFVDYLTRPFLYVFSSNFFYNPDVPSGGVLNSIRSWFHRFHMVAKSSAAKPGKLAVIEFPQSYEEQKKLWEKEVKEKFLGFKDDRLSDKSNVVVSQYKPDTAMVVELSKDEVFVKIQSTNMLDDHKNEIEKFLLSYTSLINNSEQDLINRVVKLLELYEQSDESIKKSIYEETKRQNEAAKSSEGGCMAAYRGCIDSLLSMFGQNSDTYVAARRETFKSIVSNFLERTASSQDISKYISQLNNSGVVCYFIGVSCASFRGKTFGEGREYEAHAHGIHAAIGDPMFERSSLLADKPNLAIFDANPLIRLWNLSGDLLHARPLVDVFKLDRLGCSIDSGGLFYRSPPFQERFFIESFDRLSRLFAQNGQRLTKDQLLAFQLRYVADLAKYLGRQHEFIRILSSNTGFNDKCSRFLKEITNQRLQKQVFSKLTLPLLMLDLLNDKILVRVGADGQAVNDLQKVQKSAKPSRLAYLKSVTYGIGLFLLVPLQILADLFKFLLKNVWALIKWPFSGLYGVFTGSGTNQYLPLLKREFKYFIAGAWQLLQIPFLLFADVVKGFSSLVSHVMYGLLLAVLSGLKVALFLPKVLLAFTINRKLLDIEDQEVSCIRSKSLQGKGNLPALSDADVSKMKDEVQRAKSAMRQHRLITLPNSKNKVSAFKEAISTLTAKDELKQAEENLKAAEENLKTAEDKLSELAYDLQGKIMNLIKITGKGNINDYAEEFKKAGFDKLPITDPVALPQPNINDID